MIGAIVAGGLSVPTAPVTTSYDSIATGVGTGLSNQITFTSIPSGYKHLQIRGVVQSTTGGSGNSGCSVQFNGDTTFANYTYHRLIGNGSTASAYGQAGGDYPVIAALGGYTYATSAAIIDLLDYSNTSKYKTMRVLDGSDLNDTNGVVGLKSQLWMNTNAISSITIQIASGSFSTLSKFALYGIKG